MPKLLILFGLGLWTVASPAEGEETRTIAYKFKPGQVLRYDGKQPMAVESTVSGTTQKSVFQIDSVREWRVLECDEKGNARLAMMLVRVQVDATSADGKKIEFDTDKDREKNPLTGVIGKPLVEVKLSPAGQVLDIRESQAAAAGQFVAHVRTLIYPLPDRAVAPGTSWQQDLELPLPPPIGNGEKVRLRRSFRLEKLSEAVATINLESAVAEEIKDKGLMTRIAQFLPNGGIELDLSRGVVRSLELTLDQTVNDFAGPDSVMRVTGSYREVLREDLAGTARRRQ